MADQHLPYTILHSTNANYAHIDVLDQSEKETDQNQNQNQNQSRTQFCSSDFPKKIFHLQLRSNAEKPVSEPWHPSRAPSPPAKKPPQILLPLGCLFSSPKMGRSKKQKPRNGTFEAFKVTRFHREAAVSGFEKLKNETVL